MNIPEELVNEIRVAVCDAFNVSDVSFNCFTKTETYLEWQCIISTDKLKRYKLRIEEI
jgi:hypothetical protein